MSQTITHRFEQIAGDNRLGLLLPECWDYRKLLDMPAGAKVFDRDGDTGLLLGVTQIKAKSPIADTIAKLLYRQPIEIVLGRIKERYSEVPENLIFCVIELDKDDKERRTCE